MRASVYRAYAKGSGAIRCSRESDQCRFIELIDSAHPVVDPAVRASPGLIPGLPNGVTGRTTASNLQQRYAEIYVAVKGVYVVESANREIADW